MTSAEYWRIVVGLEGPTEVVAEHGLSVEDAGHWLDRAEAAAWRGNEPVPDEWIEHSKIALARLRRAAA